MTLSPSRPADSVQLRAVVVVEAFGENLRPESAPFVPFLPGPAAKHEQRVAAGLPGASANYCTGR
jgi:hypothetical protein